LSTVLELEIHQGETEQKKEDCCSENTHEALGLTHFWEINSLRIRLGCRPTHKFFAGTGPCQKNTTPTPTCERRQRNKDGRKMPTNSPAPVPMTFWFIARLGVRRIRT
jgi:hypothetical protein